MEPAARNPRWVTLETSDGRKLAGRTTFERPVLAGRSADLFDWVEQEDGRVALRSLATQCLVGVSAEGVSAKHVELDEGALFEPVDAAGGGVAFRLAGGSRYLSAPPGDEARLVADATAVGPAESFTAVPLKLSRRPRGGHGCCGAWTLPEEGEDHPGTLWNDMSHQEILRSAVASLAPFENEAVWQFRWFWKLPGFEKQTFQGLDDADYKYPWCGNLIVDHEDPRKRVFTWHDHFYNPKSGLNYLKGETNALTEGRRWFNLSVHAAARALKLGDAPPASVVAKAAHCLGVALHFLTDLTQPMHSANYTNIFGEEGNPNRDPRYVNTLHSGLENYAETLVKNGYFRNYTRDHPLKPEDIETNMFRNVASFLQRTAENHYDLFNRPGGILALAREKASRRSNDWGPELDPSLRQSLLQAPKVVARFLVFWSRCVKQTWDSLDQGHWYRFVEPTQNDWVCLDGRHYKREKLQDGHGRLFFLFNPDGTWSIGCQELKNNIWLGYNFGFDEHWIGENRETLKEPAPTSRFRFVRDGASGAYDDVWIYESTRDEAVTVSPGGTLWRWPACHPERQIFKLQKMEVISETERNRIREHWPGFLTPGHPWYGQN